MAHSDSGPAPQRSSLRDSELMIFCPTDRTVRDGIVDFCNIGRCISFLGWNFMNNNTPVARPVENHHAILSIYSIHFIVTFFQVSNFHNFPALQLLPISITFNVADLFVQRP